MNMPTLVKACCWARLMTDSNLLVVPKELKPLMDMRYHFPLNLAWFTCTPSESFLIMIFNSTLKSLSHASVLDHGITPSLHEEVNQETDDSLLQDSIVDEFGELQHSMVQQLNVFWDSNSTETGEHTFHIHLHESHHAEQDWKSLRPYFG